jgi:hypothetical protein
MFAHPELVPIALAFAFMAGLVVITWLAGPKPIRYPDDPWFTRLSYWAACHHIERPKLTAWAFSIATAGEWVHNAFTNHRLIEELEEVHGRLGRLLCEASNGQASKTNYSSETMSGLVQAAQEDMVNDRLVDALADLPNYDFPWGKVKLLCQYMEVSEGEVAERRRQKKEMAKLVAKTHRERKAAIKSKPVLKMGVTLTTERVDARAALPNGNTFKHLVDSTN